MKSNVIEKSPRFTPIQLNLDLENLEEVEKIYALFNNSCIVEALELQNEAMVIRDAIREATPVELVLLSSRFNSKINDKFRDFWDL